MINKILQVIGFIMFCSFIVFGIYAVMTFRPDFSRAGQKVLIDNKDTAIIIKEDNDSYRPEWAAPRSVTVSYKDGHGKYVEQEFFKNRITVIEE